jgi:UDP-N-acetylglucosamine 2-epimerase (non-hydrolysing)
MSNGTTQQDLQPYIAKRAEIDLSIEVVLLLVGGVYFILFGMLLFLIDQGVLPYSEDSMYGLFVVLVSMQIITMGKTPFGDLLRSWLVVVIGLFTAFLGTLAIFYPGYMSISIRMLAGLIVLVTGTLGLIQLFTSKDKARVWMKIPGILQQLTIACALVAVKKGVAVVHVEAGLRSFDRVMPEEINRVLTDQISDLLFTTEPDGERNLLREGVDPARIHFVGNVMIDTLLHSRERAASPTEVLGGLCDPRVFLDSPTGYGVLTLHRPSNVDDPSRLARLVAMLRALGERLPVVFPVHPRTRERLRAAGLESALSSAPGVRALEPLGYRESLGLMASARLVLTDSGGVQEETSHLGVPCLTLRPNTERPVTVSLGTNTVVGEEIERVLPLVDDVLAGRYKKGQAIPGWDGHAAERVVAALAERYGGRPSA